MKHPIIDLNDFQLVAEEIHLEPPIRKPIDQVELDKLKATKRLGGLIPEPSELLKRMCSKVGPLPK